MPKTSKGHKRPADVISNAVTVMKIATGEIDEGRPASPKKRSAGRQGGRARAKALSEEERRDIARAAAAARWKKSH